MAESRGRSVTLNVSLGRRHSPFFFNLSKHSLVFVEFVVFSISQLIAMDASARVTMKDAAKCDKRCEWQNSANQ